MRSGSATLTGGQGSRTIGVVSGFVFKLARQSTSLTQEKLAEILRVDVSTIQGWESGRRPLAAINAGDFLRLSSRLARLGAPASTGRHLREAIEADQVLSTGITAGATWIDPDTHPLAANVHRRTLTNLITWPITKHIPQHLNEFTQNATRRGPAATAPALRTGERTRFLDHLMIVAERGVHADEALLRRQAVYLLGFDERPQASEWLRVEWQRAGRRPVRQGAITHWIGELGDEQTSDAFMLDDDAQSWSGVCLLRHLANRLEPGSAHLPLNLHTLHSLIASRPSLVSGQPAIRISLHEALDKLASTDDLTRTERDQLAGLLYGRRGR